jgi:hypothetical protein
MSSFTLTLDDFSRRVRLQDRIRGRLELSVNGMRRIVLRGVWSLPEQPELFDTLVCFRLPWADFYPDLRTLHFTDHGHRLDAVTRDTLPFLFLNPEHLKLEDAA